MKSSIKRVVDDLLYSPIHALFAFSQLIWGIYDQTHYHYNALLSHGWIFLIILVQYFQSIPDNFIAHFFHQKYLRELGMESTPSLMDNGTLVWKSIASEGNVIATEPAARVTGLLNNASGNPAQLSISSLALSQMWKVLQEQTGFSFSDSVFVDFGCGTGLAVLSAMSHYFKQVIGVELNVNSAMIARANVAKYRSNTKAVRPARCHEVEIVCQDMAQFDFASAGYEDTCVAENSNSLAPSKPTIVLYMYEPLWTLAKADALVIYRRILLKAKASDRKIVVVYFSAPQYSGDARPALAEVGAVLWYQQKYSSLFFGPPNDLLVYKM